jgi:hypothetical protein
MGILGLFGSGRGLRGLVYTLFGALVLSALWVTSLSFLSARSNATELLTEAGTQVLNPFLVDHSLGLSQSTYASLEATARGAPSQPLTFSVLKVRVLGREIVHLSYASMVRLVYSRVADGYYDNGPGAVFAVPAQLQQELPNFALFNPDNVPVLPGGPTVSQLPPFLQPFFVFIGLTPETFTAGGHQRIIGLLPWFWGLVIVLGVLAVVLNRSEQKVAGLAQTVVHSTWPVVLVLVGLTVLSNVYAKTFAAYSGLLSIIRGAFLPVYGIAFLVALAVLVAFKVLPIFQQRSQAQVPAGVPVGGLPGTAMPPSFSPPMPPPAGTSGQPGRMPPIEQMPGQPAPGQQLPGQQMPGGEPPGPANPA